ncbi:MAG: trehalose-6-phosphate synthase [Dehalococcoidales bacterium]|nr:trehalose-6-phosphate synthase [Dehalococcoidales bacterium]
MNTKWTKHSLYRTVREKLGSRLFVVVSNREPYVHTMSGGAISSYRPVGGLTQALDPVLRAAGGIWVAHGGGDADKLVVDKHNRVRVPPEKPEYTLRRTWLTRKEIEGFYLGFSNEALWPLCHIAFTPPVFREADWQYYRKVNGIFARAVMEEVGDKPAVVFIQDYHLALLAQMLKGQNPNLIVGQFWHIPWPPPEVFRTCPWAAEILEGLLGNDLLGFHTRESCDNFLETAQSLGARVYKKQSAITYQQHTVQVQPFPISVDFTEIAAGAKSRSVIREMARLRRELHLGDKWVGIGMDRLDYTKGIPERLLALRRFFADNPDYRGKVVFIQAGMPSRTEIESYRAIDHEIEELVRDINQRYGTGSWQPVIPLSGQQSPAALAALHRIADFCVVSSRHDGMNLVAKEYAAARTDNNGVLILSRFTGAAEELSQAIIINPFDVAGFARAIKEAIEMPAAEKRRRIRAMRKTIAENNIYRWGADIVSYLIALAEG